MPTITSMNHVVDGINLASIARAALSQALIDHVSEMLVHQMDQDLYMGWQIISANPDIERAKSIVQAFGYHDADPAFEFQFKVFIQRLLSAIWRQDQELASVLARTLSSYDLTAANVQPQVLTKLDVILLNDAMINARILPKRNSEVPQTYVDKYGMPAGGGGKEGKDYFYHDTDEATCKLKCLRLVFDGDIVRWNERDWRDGMYGDPGDLSVSGTNTGWVVQRKVRVDTQARGSQGRLPGSYRNSNQPEDDGEASHGAHDIYDEGNNSESVEDIGSRDTRSQFSTLQQSVPTRDEPSLIDKTNLRDVSTQADQSPRYDAIADFSTTSHLSPSRMAPSQDVGVVLSDKPAELSRHDRQLLESYRRNFEVQEEARRAARRQRAEEKKLIRTKSEEELARNRNFRT